MFAEELAYGGFSEGIREGIDEEEPLPPAAPATPRTTPRTTTRATEAESLVEDAGLGEGMFSRDSSATPAKVKNKLIKQGWKVWHESKDKGKIKSVYLTPPRARGEQNRFEKHANSF